MPDPKPRHLSPALLALVAANLIPLVGVLVFDWDTGDILMAYWLENVAVGLINILKLLTNRHPDTKRADTIFLAVFFTVHYGIFTFVHGAFVINLTGDSSQFGSLIETMQNSFLNNPWVFLGFFASHFFSYLQNYLMKGEASKIPLGRVMSLPYSRIVILHLTIIIGGIVVTSLGNPIALVVILVILKTAGDITLHRKEHSRRSNS